MAYRAWLGPFNNLRPAELYVNGQLLTLPHSSVVTPGTKTVTYEEDTTTNFLNPERGWVTNQSSTSQLSTLRANGYTVNWTSIYEGSIFRLDDFRYGPISSTRLTSIRNYFQAARTAGVKLKVRFAYNGNPIPAYAEDASEAIILSHIAQLRPIWREYADVIAMLDHGFIGKWGEQHSSTNGLSDNTTQSREARIRILNAILEALPASRMVGSRYPPYIREAYPEGEVFTGFTHNGQPYPTAYQFDSEDRFNGSNRSRVGWLNDCFLSNESNTGTFSTWDAPQPQRFTLDRSTFSAIGPYTVASGETCGTSLNSYNSSSAAISEMELMGGPDLLNREYSATIYNRWINEGYYDEITRRLGYRISLIEATLPEEVSPGNQYEITLRLKNSGFGKLYNPRALRLVFEGSSTFEVTLSEDCRREMPLGGETVDSVFTFVAPPGLTKGESYNLHLKFPDTSTSVVNGVTSYPIENDVRYMIRLSNIGTWNETHGYNSLNHSVLATSGVVTPPPQPGVGLLGVGSASNSLTEFPKTGPVYNGDWWVDPKASTNGTGTQQSPFNNLASAFSSVQDGQRIIIRGGTINVSSRIERTTNWTTGIEVFNYGTERVVLDGSSMPEGETSQAIRLRGRREHWKGFYVKNANGEYGSVYISGNYNIVEDFWVSHNSCLYWYEPWSTYRSGGGIYITAENTTDGSKGSYNIVQDCAVWRIGKDNVQSTNVADGIVCTAWNGSSYSLDNRIVRCFVAHGPDDCYDLFRSRGTHIIDSVAYAGGYRWDGTNSGGDGGNFKMGGVPGGGNSLIGSIGINARGENIKPNTGDGQPGVSFYRCTAVSTTGSGWGFTEDNTGSIFEDTIVWGYSTANMIGEGSNSTRRNNNWSSPLGTTTAPSNPQFADASNWDFSLVSGSSSRGAGVAGGNLGASEIALSIAKEWIARDLTAEADVESGGGEPTPPPVPQPEPEDTLIGVGSASTSLVDYPKIPDSYSGDWYVDGSVASSGDGTSLATAFKTLQEGLAALGDGETLLVKGGTYSIGEGIVRSTSWSSPTYIKGYGNDRPVLDGSNVNPNVSGIRMSGAENEIWHGFWLRNVIGPTQVNHYGGQAWAFVDGSTDNILSNVWVSDCGGTGIFSYNTSGNQIRDCASWKLGDGVSQNTNVPDCIALSGGSSNWKIVRSFFAYGPDDCLDLWSSINMEVIDCVAYAGGYYWNGNVGDSSYGDGSGFKMAGTGSANNTVRGSVAFACRSNGFATNAIRETFNYYNNTSVNNGEFGFDLSGDYSQQDGIAQNNIAFGNSRQEQAYAAQYVQDSFNTWNIPINDPQLASISERDFSLAVGSAAIGAGSGGSNLGASDIALAIAKAWITAVSTGNTPSEPTTPTPPSGEFSVYNYTEDLTTDFPNPERGWYVEGGFGSELLDPPVSSLMSENRPTLHLYYVNLRDFLYTDTISTSFLNNMVSAFNSARAAGVKLIVRHAYNRSDVEVPEDVSLARMQAHITQLAPYWQQHQDVIAVLQAGFVGPWGEMWRSDHIDTNGERQSLISHLMANTPSNMMVQWRDPGVWTMYTYSTGATYANRFNGTAVQRAGHWNDCIGNGYEMVTYWDGNWTTEQQMTYVENISRVTPFGGEGCQDTGSWDSQYSDGDYIIQKLTDFHADYHNHNYSNFMINKWSNSGHLAEISRRLGYRISLVSSILPTEVSPGEQFPVTLTLRNRGFGKVFNRRPIDLVFVNGAETHTVRLTEDARRDLPLGGEVVESTWNVIAPVGLVAGRNYNMHLRLPDPSPTLQSNNKYSIRLANTGVWDGSTGRNNLNASILVSGEAPGTPTTLGGVGSGDNSSALYPPTGPVVSGDWWVDPNASTNGTGSQSSPFNNLGSALSVVQDGQRIIVRGGTLTPTSRYNRSVNWSTGIEVFAFGNERVILDGSLLAEGSASRILNMTGSREHWKGFHVKNAKASNGSVSIEGTHYTLEDFWISDNDAWYYDPSWQQFRGGGGVYVTALSTTNGSRGSHNKFIDMRIWRIGNTSGSGTNLPDCLVFTANTGYYGINNVVVRTFAAHGPDDCYDFFRSRNSFIYDSVAYRGGYFYTGNATSGDGGNFKMGGNPGGGNSVIGCIGIDARGENIKPNTADNMPGVSFIRTTAVSTLPLGSGGYGFTEDDTGSLFEDTIVWGYSSSNLISEGANTTKRGNNWSTPLGSSTSAVNPNFHDTTNWDFSLGSGSPLIAAGYTGGNLGASVTALEIAKEWIPIVLGLAEPGTPPSGEEQTVTFAEDTTTDFINPERGWMIREAHTSSNFINARSGDSDNPSGYSVVWSDMGSSPWNGSSGTPFRLDSYRTANIPSSLLTRLNQVFAAARSAGVKMKIRFAYNYSGNGTDTTQAWMETHIEQLAPTINANRDVIASMDAGFIGLWGEWHGSTHLVDSTNSWWLEPWVSARRSVMTKLLDEIHPDISIGMRDPRGDKGYRSYFNGSEGRANWATHDHEANRFDGSDISRVGWYNDCLWTDQSHSDTFDYYTPSNTANDILAASKAGRIAATSGETCERGGLNQYNDASFVIDNGATSAVVLGGPDTLYRKYWDGVYDKWITQGRYNEFSRRLGYRLTLLDATLPQSITPGQPFSVSLTIKNSGFGKVYNKRPIDLVFVNGGDVVTVRLDEDSRRKLPLAGDTVESTWTAVAPLSLTEESSYNMYLRLPDPDPLGNGLDDDVRYCIRFANVGIWDGATGRHNLNASVYVEGIGTPGTFEARTESSNDVAYARHSPTTSWGIGWETMYPTSTSVRDTTNSIRWKLNVPKNSTINSVTITLYEAQNGAWVSGQDQFTLGFEQVDNSSQITSQSNMNSRRSNVGTTYQVNLVGNTLLGYGHEITIPASMIQEIVNRPGWVSGNYVTLFLNNPTNGNANNGQLQGHFTRATDKTPKIHVEYET